MATTEAGQKSPNPAGDGPDKSSHSTGVAAREQPGRVAAEVDTTNLDFILDIPLEITVELGRTRMLIKDLLKMGQGSVIELTKPAGDTLEILANNRLIAKGDVVMLNDKYGVRLTEVITPEERLEQLK